MKTNRLWTKSAASDNDFEASLWQIAFDKLQNKLGNLLPYLVGFEIVQKNPDNTKAIGVFGFKSKNGHVLYVPVFFINGKVWDLDCLYSKNNDQFWPLNEDTAQLFLKDDTTGMGSVSEETKQQIQTSAPAVDYKDFLYPPRTGRTAFASVIDYLDKADNNVKTAALNLMQKHGSFLEACSRFYSAEEMAKALALRSEKKAAVKEAAVTIYKLGAKSIPEDLIKKVAADGFAIKDVRDSGKKSQFGDFDYVSRFSNPDQSGFYTYVTKQGTLRYGLVLLKPSSLLAGYPAPPCYVLDLKSKEKGQLYPCENRDVLVKDYVEVKDPGAVKKLLQDPVEALPSYYKQFILLNPDTLHATEAFVVEQSYKDQNGIHRLVVRPQDCCTRIAPVTKGIGDEEDRGKDSTLATIVFTKKDGDLPVIRGKFVYVPKGFKLMEVSTEIYVDPQISYNKDSAETIEKKRQAASEEESRLKAGQPGGKIDIEALFFRKGVFPINVRTDGVAYWAKIQDIEKKYNSMPEAKIGMVVDYGMDLEDASKLVSSLIPNCPKKGWLKTAALGDYIPAQYEEAASQDPLGNPMYMGIPGIDFAPNDAPPPRDATRPEIGEVDPAAMNGQGGNIQDDIQNASQLAEKGQKQVFDTQAIATIAKYVDPSTKVLSYIPDFIGTMDKLGRTLFLIYWETEKFKKMYGDDDIPELIELLKNVFKNMGDLVIFFKRKFPDIGINSNEQSVKEI